MDWQPAPDRLVELVEEDLEQAVREAHYVRLPFYEDGYLVHAETAEGPQRLVLGGQVGVTVVLLDGTAPQIKMANRIAGLCLNRENVADYVRYFCGHLATRYGDPYDIAESCDGKLLENGHQLRNMGIRVGHQGEDGVFRVGCYQVINDTLFRVSFKVPPDGILNMVRDLKLGQLLSVN